MFGLQLQRRMWLEKEKDRNGCFHDKLFCLNKIHYNLFQSEGGPDPKLDTDILNVLPIKQEISAKGFSFVLSEQWRLQQKGSPSLFCRSMLSSSLRFYLKNCSVLFGYFEKNTSKFIKPKDNYFFFHWKYLSFSL